jgi:hypothetical protein
MLWLGAAVLAGCNVGGLTSGGRADAGADASAQACVDACTAWDGRLYSACVAAGPSASCEADHAARLALIDSVRRGQCTAGLLRECQGGDGSAGGQGGGGQGGFGGSGGLGGQGDFGGAGGFGGDPGPPPDFPDCDLGDRQCDGEALLSCGPEGWERTPCTDDGCRRAGAGDRAVGCGPDPDGEARCLCQRATPACEPGRRWCEADTLFECQGDQVASMACTDEGCRAAGLGPLRGCGTDTDGVVRCLCSSQCDPGTSMCEGNGGRDCIDGRWGDHVDCNDFCTQRGASFSLGCSQDGNNAVCQCVTSCNPATDGTRCDPGNTDIVWGCVRDVPRPYWTTQDCLQRCLEYGYDGSHGCGRAADGRYDCLCF